MKKVIINLLNNFFQNFDYHLIKNRELQEKIIYRKFLESLLLNQASSKEVKNPEINQERIDVNFVVFSKDRALQLHALLSSLYANVTPIGKIHVLYRASNQAHAQSYYQVQSTFIGKDIVFYPENQFKKDLIDLVNSLPISKLIFLVDDIVFTEPLDLEDFIQADPDLYVASLRMGEHLNFSYTVQKPQPLPQFLKTNTLANSKDKIVWKWRDGALDWNYPLSVDGHLFSLKEIRAMLPLLDFKAPNSLEESMQILKPYYWQKLGVAYKKAKIVNIPCNKVQVENNNIAEHVSTDFLLQKWLSGYQININKLFHLENTSAHQYVPFEFTKRPGVKITANHNQ